MWPKKRTALWLTSFLAIVLASIPVNASSFSFEIPLTSGSTTGAADGLLTLPCSSGTCAASSLVLTSVPAAFGSFPEGLVVTNWTNQVQNQFTITGGVITSVLFIADDGIALGENVCMNSTGAEVTNNDASGYACPAGLNIVETTGSNFGFNFSGLSGVTFAPATSTPEPGTLTTALCGAIGLTLISIKRRRRTSGLLTACHSRFQPRT